MGGLLRSFYQIQEKYPDCIILIRNNDFYETFGETAEKVSGIIGTKLTERPKYKFTGFNQSALDAYLPKLVRAGYRVAIADQI